MCRLAPPEVRIYLSCKPAPEHDLGFWFGHGFTPSCIGLRLA
jgi:hypothetical protein